MKMQVGVLASVLAVALLAAAPAHAEFARAPLTANFGVVAAGSTKDVSVTATFTGTGNSNPDLVPDEYWFSGPASAPNPQFTLVGHTCGTEAAKKPFVAGTASCVLTFRFASTGAAVHSTYFGTFYVRGHNNITNAPWSSTEQTWVGLVGNTLCGGLQPTIVSLVDEDFIVGTPGNDVILSLGGFSTANGAGGNDVVCGGDGEDVLLGGSGNDKLIGGAGKDTLKGGTGRDVCKGGPGADRARKCERVRSIP